MNGLGPQWVDKQRNSAEKRYPYSIRQEFQIPINPRSSQTSGRFRKKATKPYLSIGVPQFRFHIQKPVYPSSQVLHFPDLAGQGLPLRQGWVDLQSVWRAKLGVSDNTTVQGANWPSILPGTLRSPSHSWPIARLVSWNPDPPERNASQCMLTRPNNALGLDWQVEPSADFFPEQPPHHLQERIQAPLPAAENASYCSRPPLSTHASSWLYYIRDL